MKEVVRVKMEMMEELENDRQEETSGALGQVEEASYGVVHNF